MPQEQQAEKTSLQLKAQVEELRAVTELLRMSRAGADARRADFQTKNEELTTEMAELLQGSDKGVGQLKKHISLLQKNDEELISRRDDRIVKAVHALHLDVLALEPPLVCIGEVDHARDRCLVLVDPFAK